MKYNIILLLLIVGISSTATAQISFSDTIHAYNKARIITNAKGMGVLGSWGVLNMAAGGIGYFTAKQNEWKYFHEMNAIWGVANIGIAGLGYRHAKKEMATKTDASKAWANYKRDKKIYLINMGLDVVYTGIGAGLVQLSKNDKTNPEMYRGFGKSLAIQGMFLLVFDNIMLASHNKYSYRWVRIIDELRFTGSGIGFNYTFPVHSIGKHAPHIKI